MNSLRIAAVIAALALAGCQGHYSQVRADATPFALADDDCWQFSGSTVAGDYELAYAKCMARHGWTGCGPANPCKRDRR